MPRIVRAILRHTDVLELLWSTSTFAHSESLPISYRRNFQNHAVSGIRLRMWVKLDFNIVSNACSCFSKIKWWKSVTGSITGAVSLSVVVAFVWKLILLGDAWWIMSELKLCFGWKMWCLTFKGPTRLFWQLPNEFFYFIWPFLWDLSPFITILSSVFCIFEWKLGI